MPVSCSSPSLNVNNSRELVQGRVFNTQQIICSQCASPPRFFVRQSRLFDERQTGKLQLITAHFQYTAGISAVPVVDMKNARVCIADKMSGFTMRFPRWPWNTVSMSHEEAELSGVSDEEVHQLVATASEAKRSAVVQCSSWLRAPPHLRLRGVTRATYFCFFGVGQFSCLTVRPYPPVFLEPIPLGSALPIVMPFPTPISNVQ